MIYASLVACRSLRHVALFLLLVMLSACTSNGLRILEEASMVDGELLSPDGSERITDSIVWIDMSVVGEPTHGVWYVSQIAPVSWGWFVSLHNSDATRSLLVAMHSAGGRVELVDDFVGRVRELVSVDDASAVLLVSLPESPNATKILHVTTEGAQKEIESPFESETPSHLFALRDKVAVGTTTKSETLVSVLMSESPEEWEFRSYTGIALHKVATAGECAALQLVDGAGVTHLAWLPTAQDEPVVPVAGFTNTTRVPHEEVRRLVDFAVRCAPPTSLVALVTDGLGEVLVEHTFRTRTGVGATTRLFPRGVSIHALGPTGRVLVFEEPMERGAPSIATIYDPISQEHRHIRALDGASPYSIGVSIDGDTVLMIREDTGSRLRGEWIGIVSVADAF